MPPVTRTGKSGTVTPAEFETLTTLVNQFGPMVVNSKVSKICDRMASGYLHENPGSAVGLAWKSLSTKIGAASTGTPNRGIPNASFEFLTGLVTNYGAEVIVRKLAKLATRTGNTANSTTLKALFPKTATAHRAA